MTTAAVRDRAAARRAAGPVSGAAPEPPRPVLTGRALLLGLVLAMLVFTLAVPARALFGQRAEIAALRADTAATAANVAALEDRSQRLQDPAYVESLIRTRLHYVMPGEIGYTVLEPDEAPAPGQATAPVGDGSWYGRLWSTVEVADGDPARAPDGSEVVIRPDAPR